jgi:hypothetical protein
MRESGRTERDDGEKQERGGVDWVLGDHEMSIPRSPVRRTGANDEKEAR